MKEIKILIAVLIMLMVMLAGIIVVQDSRIEALEARVQEVEHENTIVLNSCKTVGQMVLEQGARWNGAEK